MQPASSLARAHRAVTALFFLLGFGGANWLVHVPAVRHKLQLGDLALGCLLLCGGLGALTAFRTARFFHARLSHAHIVILGTVGAAACLFVPAWAQTPWLAATGLLANGFCNGLVDVSVNACAVDVEHRLRRPVLSRMHGFCSLGSFAGAATGVGATYLALSPTVHLLAVGAATAAAALLLRPALLPDAPADAAALAPVPWTAPLVLLGCVAFCSSVGEGAMAQWTGVYLHDELMTSTFVASVGYACYAAAMVTGRLLGDSVANLWSPGQVFRRCGALVATCLAAGLCSRHAGVMIVGGMGVGLGLSLVIPTVFRCAVRLPRLNAGAAISRVATLSYGGFLFGPPTIGLIAQLISLRVALGVVAVLAVPMAVLGARVVQDLPSPKSRPAAS